MTVFSVIRISIMVKDLIDKTKKYIVKIAKEKRTPHQTAMGFAIGSFVAILPSPGVNILFCVLAALIYRKINKFTLFGALAFWNTLLMIPIWAIGAKLGKLVLGNHSGEFKIQVLNRLSDYIQANFTTAFNMNNILSKAFDIGVDLWAGTAIIAVFVGVTSYFVVKYIAKKHSEHSFFKHIKHYHNSAKDDHKKANSFEKKIRKILNKNPKDKKTEMKKSIRKIEDKDKIPKDLKNNKIRRIRSKE